MTDNFFPIRIYADPNFGGGPWDYRKIFDANRPKEYKRVEKWRTFVHERWEKFIYYQFDVIVLSQTEVEFVCFDMEDFCYGGRGKEIHRFRVTVDKSVTRKTIETKLFNRAMFRRDTELAAEELKICNRYADEERKALGISF